MCLPLYSMPFGTFTLSLPHAFVSPIQGTSIPCRVLGQQIFQFLHSSFQGVAVFGLVPIGLVVRAVLLVLLALLSGFSEDGRMFLLHDQVGVRAFPGMRHGGPFASLPEML